MLERLLAAIDSGGGSIVFHIDNEPRRLEVAELYETALIRAGRLVDAGVGPGVRVGVVGPNAPEFVAWIYATWMLGATAVPFPVPLRVRDRAAVSAQLTALARGFECSYVAAHERFAALLPADLVLDWDARTSSPALPASRLVHGDADSIAYIQPTSGSTAAPKGIGRSYAHITNSNLSAMVNPFNAETVRYLSYSPLAHAGGSLGVYAMVQPWLEMHLLSIERFVRDPLEFFRLIGRHQITMTIAGSSTIAAAVHALERQPEGIDLSSLEWFPFAYELVDPDVVDRLNEIGGRCGLRQGVVGAYYGMSEGGGSRTPPGEGLRVERVDLDALVSSSVARPAGPGVSVKRVASCGAPFTLELRIAEAATPLPDRHVGEVQFRGVGLMNGYVGIGAEDAFDDDGWMHTGDVGYLADGELFVTGRSKEVVIQHGKKYHPEDIERAAAMAAEVGPAECVAFSPLGADEGAVVIAIETESTTELDGLEQRVRASVINRVGISPQSVVFVPPAALPKTASGKAQRLAARELYARGELRVRT